MKLSHVVIGDPVAEVAQATSFRCERFALGTSIATTGAEFLKKVKKHKPTLVLLSLELLHPNATEVATRLRKKYPKTMVIGTYRELAVSTVEKLRPLGISYFIPHPPSLPQILSILSDRFGISARLHPRFETQFNVYRADGVLIGKTRNMSSRGILVHTFQPHHPDQSVLLDLELPDEFEKPLRIRCRVVEIEGKPPEATLARIAFEKVLTTNHRRMSNYLLQLEKRA